MTVLVALERGKAGEALLASARMLAHAAGWGVRVVHVRPDDDSPPLRLPQRLRTNTEILEPVGDPAAEVLAAAAADDVQLLAFCLRSAAGAGVGHVADALLRGADLPLLVTRAGARPVGALKRLLVPLSGEPSTSAAMSFAEDHFCARGREIIAVHVATAALQSQPGSMAAPRMVDQEQYEWSDWNEEFGMRFAYCPAGGGRHRTVVRAGKPAAVVVDEATTIEAELIVLAWSRELGEGTSRQVKQLLEQAPCPLVLVPETQLPAS
jgi:nucleotide-binding universal stress UspA family protein